MLKALIGQDSFVNPTGEYGSDWFHDVPYGTPNYLRSLEFPALRKSLKAVKSPIILLKPLHETQRITDFLDEFSDAPAIFSLRHYYSVVQSHLHYYSSPHSLRYGTQGHDPFEYVRGILPSAEPTWKNENHSQTHQNLVEELWQHVESPADAYALYWLSRNQLYFDQELEDRVALVRFERILESPSQSLASLSKHIRHGIPKRNALIVTKPKFDGEKTPPSIHPKIQKACEELHQRLGEVEERWFRKLVTSKSK
jgi:hypothetical protein